MCLKDFSGISTRNKIVNCNSIIYVSDSVTWFFLSYETMVELLIINRNFPTIGSQLPRHHSKAVANLNYKEMSSNNGTSIFMVGFPKSKIF